MGGKYIRQFLSRFLAVRREEKKVTAVGVEGEFVSRWKKPEFVVKREQVNTQEWGSLEDGETQTLKHRWRELLWRK